MAPCVFSICSRNYLHYGRTLMESLRHHAPHLQRILVLCDENREINPPIPENEFELISVSELGIPDLPQMITRYTLMELNTAIKPYVFLYLLQKRDFKQVIYFDPDIRVYHSLDSITKRLESNRIVLTPHLTDPITDNRHPTEKTFLLCGTYNLGFLAVRNDAEVFRFLSWWSERLEESCVVDLPGGLFVDQKWINLVPGLFNGVEITRDPGWNVAYWNLSSRNLTVSGDQTLLVNESPLIFFHFSGVNVAGTVFSSHQDRFTIQNLPEPVRDLVREYTQRLQENGASSYSQIGYAFGRFPSGRPIPDFMRKLYRNHPHAAKNLGDFSASKAEENWMGYAFEIPEGFQILNRASLALYQGRIDLMEAFPDVREGNELPYANWLMDNGRDQPDMDPVFVEEVIRRLRGKPFSGTPPRSVAKGRSLKIKVYRTIYRIAWRLQRWITPLTSMAFRRKVHSFLVHLAYHHKSQPRSSSAPSKAFGINVVGYLHAESGVGHAARLSLRSAHSSGIPYSRHPFEVGCLSQQQDLSSEPTGQQVDYGTNLFHINADQTPILHSQSDPGLFEDHYNIGFWYWELPEFPEEWLDAYQHLDEIWVASSFCQEAISRKSPIPVIKMPPGVEVCPDPACDRASFGIPEDSFVFLTLADGLSFFERKNVLATLQAFEMAFPLGQTDVRLVIKLMNGRHAESGYAPLLRQAEANPAVQVLHDTLSRRLTDSLIAVCDSVVSLHRAEGFGLPLAEAMYLGKPVMGTQWSGNTDFMDESTSFPIRCRIVEIEQNYGPYQKGMHWAEPDLDHAAQTMVFIASRNPEVKIRAERGCKRIQSEYSLEVSGKRMRERLEWIHA